MQSQPDKPKPGIPMFEVTSANIKMIGYDKESLTLRIKFKTSNIFYDYKGVSAELFMELMGSDSKGKFFFTQIKGKFEFEKIEI